MNLSATIDNIYTYVYIDIEKSYGITCELRQFLLLQNLRNPQAHMCEHRLVFYTHIQCDYLLVHDISVTFEFFLASNAAFSLAAFLKLLPAKSGTSLP